LVQRNFFLEDGSWDRLKRWGAVMVHKEILMHLHKFRNDFGVQLTKTIKYIKWFWSTNHRNESLVFSPAGNH